MKPTIAIIGAGNMGSAIYKSLRGIMPEKSLVLCDKNKQKLASLTKNSTTDVNIAIAMSDIIILAVKPQSFLEFVETTKVNLSKKLLISIMAGVTTAKLTKTGAKKIIRAMPNLPAQIRIGLTGWIANKNVSANDKKMVKKIFESFGKEIEVK